MTQVRRPIIATLALFTVAITLDRIGVGSGDQAIAGYAYVFALLSVTLPLLSQARTSSPWTIPLISVGSLLAYSVAFKVGFFYPAATHLAITELVFVAVAARLGGGIAAGLDRIDGLLLSATVGESPALDLEGPTAANEIHTEIGRGRRHDRPLSVTVLAPTVEGLERALDSAALELDRTLRTRFVIGTFAKTVAAQLRRSDLLFEHRPSGRLIVLSPETDAEGTELLVTRILRAATRTGIDARAGSASFPGDGIGFESLVDHAQAELDSAAEPRLRAVEEEGAA